MIGPFDYNAGLVSEQLDTLAGLRAAFKQLDILLDGYCDAGRYKTLAKISLEEAAMWANKSVTHGDKK